MYQSTWTTSWNYLTTTRTYRHMTTGLHNVVL
ncbi:hypothetical protein ABp57_gp37 [Acinetobacter phage ABp57]|nr:hypothetical protein ABp57_gp37 [Acinetobacter phage ABp57]